MAAPDTIQVFVPLKVRRKNGRPKILPPADYLPSEDQTQDPHILRAIGRAWSWRRRMEAGEFGTVRDLAIAVNLAERHVSRQLRLAYLAPEVLKRLTCGREVTAVTLMRLRNAPLCPGGIRRRWCLVKLYKLAEAHERPTAGLRASCGGWRVRARSHRCCKI